MNLEQMKHIGKTIVRYANSELEETRPLYEGDLWIRPSIPRSEPVRIELEEGFTFYETGGPRIPIVGAKALHTAKLHGARPPISLEPDASLPFQPAILMAASDCFAILTVPTWNFLAIEPSRIATIHFATSRRIKLPVNSRKPSPPITGSFSRLLINWGGRTRRKPQLKAKFLDLVQK